MNSNWKECKLGNVAEFKNGKSRPSEIVNGAIPIYGGNGILGYTDTFNYQGETVIVGRVGAYCGSVFFENKPIWVSDNALYTIPKNETDAKFLYYLLKSMGLNSQAEGSSHPLLTQTLLNSLDVFVTDSLPEQRAIAGVLSSLDDKIDLLHRQNKTLEGMAESLWRKMFVEDTKNLKIVNLGEIIEIHDSKRIPLSSMQREKMKDGVLYPYYGAATVMDHINQYIFDGEYLLLGEDGTVETDDGYPVLQLATGKFWVNNHTHVLRAKKPFSNFLLYIILRNTSISHIVTGAVQPKINQENLKSLEISSAKDIIVEELSVAVDNFWQKIQANNLQIHTLSGLRNTLLPKLMTGEVRVSV